MSKGMLETCKELEYIFTTKKKMCVKLVIYKNWTKMHGQQNIKFLRCVPIKSLQHDTCGLFCIAADLKLICASETLYSNGRR